MFYGIFTYISDNESEPEDNLSYFSYDDSEMSEEEEEEISEEHWKEMLAQGRERWDALMRDFRSENEYAEFEDALKLSSVRLILLSHYKLDGETHLLRFLPKSNFLITLLFFYVRNSQSYNVHLGTTETVTRTKMMAMEYQLDHEA